ncbi:MAG TPA: hypothetical protein H9681_05310 [Firmicutes bacterium]|nr:hypothetical protein [Bacillota bacterium]
MSLELFEQGPAVYIPYFLISLLLTMVAYGAFPLLFALIRRSIISKRKYYVLCYCFNFLLMMLFIVISKEASSGFPYLLWTWVFTLSGTKILKRRDVFNDVQYVSKLRDVCENNNSFIIARMQGDNVAPKRNSNKKKLILTIFISVIYLISIGLNVIQYLKGIEANKTISNQAERIINVGKSITTKKTEILNLKNQINNLEKEVDKINAINLKLVNEIYFYRERAAIILDDDSKRYHTYSCEELISGSYWILNIEAAEQFGLYPCPKCH